MAARAAVGRRRTSRRILARGPRSAAGWVGSCDAGRRAGSDCGSASVAADVAAVAVDGGGAAASAGAAAGVEAGSSVMR